LPLASSVIFNVLLVLNVSVVGPNDAIVFCEPSRNVMLPPVAGWIYRELSLVRLVIRATPAAGNVVPCSEIAPLTSRAVPGLAVPMPTLPVELIVIRAAEFVPSNSGYAPSVKICPPSVETPPVIAEVLKPPLAAYWIRKDREASFVAISCEVPAAVAEVLFATTETFAPEAE